MNIHKVSILYLSCDHTSPPLILIWELSDNFKCFTLSGTIIIGILFDDTFGQNAFGRIFAMYVLQIKIF